MAATLRPLIFESLQLVSGNVTQSVMTTQDDTGNGKIYYNKSGIVCYKEATVVEGHWHDMTIGNETPTQLTDVKELSIDVPVVNEQYGLIVQSDISNDIASVSKNGVILGIIN